MTTLPPPMEREPLAAEVQRPAPHDAAAKPAFQRLCSCTGWPLMARLIWWALRNDR